MSWWVCVRLENALDKLRHYQRHHSDGRVRYPATDREIHLLGLLCALWELGGTGEHSYPSGVVVTWGEADDEGLQTVGASGYVSLEDLPEDVRRYFERMEPAKQPDRERFLYEVRHHAKAERKRMAWHREHGFDQPTPERLRAHLRTGRGDRGEGGS